MGWVLLALLTLLAVAPVLAELRRAPMDDAARKTAPGRFAKLPMGRTHYRWQGPENGPVAVCIHGLTTPSQVFDPLIAQLTRAGFRTLAYDLPGRGFSDTTRGRQDRAFFLRQLDALLADQDVSRIDLLIGYSMGGSIATAFAVRSPSKVRRLVLLATAGLLHDGGARANFIRRTPVIGDGVMLALGGMFMRRAVEAQGDTPLGALQLAQTRRRGFLPAVLSSQRHMLAEYMASDHRALQEADLPTLAVWGIEDTVIPISNVGRMAEMQRDARQATIPGATHALPHSHADGVMAEIATFLRETRLKARE